MTIRKYFSLLITFLVLVSFRSASVANAADGDPKATLVQLVEFSNRQALTSAEARAILTGEALDWKGATFGKLAAAPDRVVAVDGTSAVGRVQHFAEDNQVTDLYFYLSFDGVWKVRAMRALALTGIVRGAYQYLKSKPSRTAEEENEFANLKLTLASDEDLRSWFQANASAMNKLYQSSRVMKSGDFSSADNPKYTELKRQLQALHFSLAEAKQDGNAEFVIGGVTDNTVGFLYSPANQPPAISSNEYIWVEEVAPKWFLFRTT